MTADTIIRFETARALLGHVAVLPPDRVRELVESSYHRGTVLRPLLASRLRLAWWEAAVAADRDSLPMPVVPVVEDGPVLAEHTTCTGQTRLRLSWREPDQPWSSRLDLVLQRHTPIPLWRPGRLLLTALMDRWAGLAECPDSGDCGTEHGDGVDPVSPIPESWQAAAHKMASWLEWRRDSLPQWAHQISRRALWRWAAHHSVQMPTHHEAAARLRRILAELNDLDAQLIHTPDAGTGPQWTRRNTLVRDALAWAALAGLRVGWEWDTRLPDTVAPVVAYVDLPTGQVSWHIPEPPSGIPQYPDVWDGHSRAEKSSRIRSWIDSDDDVATVGAARNR